MIPLLLVLTFVSQPPAPGAALSGFVLDRPCCSTVVLAGKPAECRITQHLAGLGPLAVVCARVGPDGRCAEEIAPGSVVGVM